MPAICQIGVTHDFLRPDGTLGPYAASLQALAGQGQVHWEMLPDTGRDIPSIVAQRYDALLVGGPQITAATLAGRPRLGLVARFGVGYDNVDVAACTAAGVMLTITPDGVRRPVAASALAFLLALAHRMPAKDRMTREGRWAEKLDCMGIGLTGRTLGVIGLGNIGREVFRLAAPLEMRHVGHDPHVSPQQAAQCGVEWLELDAMIAAADFVIVCCALTSQTRHLLDARRLALLQPTAFLINVARGPIIDQAALTRALTERKLAGAGLDVFEHEPIDPRDPLLALDNVILAPHALCWTDECFTGNGRSACQSLLDYAGGRVPQHVVNRPVLENPLLQAKLASFAKG